MTLTLLIAATIWRCLLADGQVTYTDLACPSSATGREAARAPITLLPSLSPEDLERVTDIDRRTDEQLRARERNHNKQRQSRREDEVARQKSCEKVAAELQRLLNKRRQGYPLAQAGALDARELELRKKRRQRCG